MRNFKPKFSKSFDDSTKWASIGHFGGRYDTLCESDERYQLQYRFVNPLESDGNIFIDIRFNKKYKTHRRPLENF